MTDPYDQWAARDDLYVRRRYELTDEQVESVRAWRLKEARESGLPGRIQEAARWTPPSRRPR